MRMLVHDSGSHMSTATPRDRVSRCLLAIINCSLVNDRCHMTRIWEPMRKILYYFSWSTTISIRLEIWLRFNQETCLS